jgi:phthiodiolone/phenolphthiodiolone dimycocerosates ketoreductase
MLMSPSEYRNKLAAVDASRRAAGRDPVEAGLWTYVCYGESRADCLRLFESPMYKSLGLLAPQAVFDSLGVPHPLGERASGLGDFVPTWIEADELLALLERVPIEAVARTVLHGSLDDIASDLRALESAGCELAVLGNVSFLSDRDRVAPSFRAQRDLIASFVASGTGV